MDDITKMLEDRAISYDMSGPSAQHTAVLLREAKAEILRLRTFLVDAHNTWRHEFRYEVEVAADRLFKRLSASQTNPFKKPPSPTE